LFSGCHLECIPTTYPKKLKKAMIPVFKPNLPYYLCNYRVYFVEEGL
jgi:hypothetical protein